MKPAPKTDRFPKSTYRGFLTFLYSLNFPTSRIFLTISCLLLIHTSIFCVNRDWVGGNGFWAVATNWDPAGIPDLNDNLTVSSGTCPATYM